MRCFRPGERGGRVVTLPLNIVNTIAHSRMCTTYDEDKRMFQYERTLYYVKREDTDACCPPFPSPSHLCAHLFPVCCVFLLLPPPCQAFDDALRGGPDELALRERYRARTPGYFVGVALEEASPQIGLDLDSRYYLHWRHRAHPPKNMSL